MQPSDKSLREMLARVSQPSTPVVTKAAPRGQALVPQKKVATAVPANQGASPAPSPAVAEAMRVILDGGTTGLAPFRRGRPSGVTAPIGTPLTDTAPMDAADPPTIKTSSRRFVERKSLTFLNTPVGLDGRGRFTQEKADDLPIPRADVRELHDVYMSRCRYCTGIVRRRFTWPSRALSGEALTSLADMTLRDVNVVKTTPNAQLLKMVLAAISRKTVSRFKHLTPNRTVAWLDSKPLVALESFHGVIFHEAVREKAAERVRMAARCAVIHTADVLARWKCVEDKLHRPAVTLLDDLKTFHLARHELAPRQSTLPARKAKPQVEQVRKIAITPPRLPETVEVTLRPRPRVEAAARPVNAKPVSVKPSLRKTLTIAPIAAAGASSAQSLLYRAGRVWERPVENPVPAFLGRQARRAKIITVTDVNSGDGKTTLVSQLGAMLARQGDQVLLLDLDYRGALTDSCFAAEMRQQLRRAGRTIVPMLEAAGRRGRPLLECMARVSNNLWAVAADESLGVWEARERAAWLVQRDRYDVRFRLRGELQGTDICQRFDWILIDCPRRLSTAAINAFTASDYLMLAGAGQEASQAQVSQLLGWLARLNVLTGACRGLSMLGVASAESDSPAAAASAVQPVAQRSPTVASRDPRWSDGVYYFGNSVPRLALSQATSSQQATKEPVAREALAAGVRTRPNPRPAAADVRIAGLAREVKERIAARGQRQ